MKNKIKELKKEIRQWRIYGSGKEMEINRKILKTKLKAYEECQEIFLKNIDELINKIKIGCKKKWSYSNKKQGIYETYLCSNSSKNIRGTYSLMLCEKCEVSIKVLKELKKLNNGYEK